MKNFLGIFITALLVVTLKGLDQKGQENYQVKQEGNYTFGDETVTLSCSVPAIDNDVTKKEWLKNGTLISELPDKERYVAETTVNNSLTISKTTREDAGIYVLRFHRKALPPYNCNVAFRAEPLVKKFDKSKNLIEDDTLELQCEVLGYPYPKIIWLQNGQVVNSTNNVRVELSPLNGYDNARLLIKSVKFEDAGDYTCKAHSEYFQKEVSQVIVVRVKDKLAALWPFLGIVGEVVILCAIIFIYEKRRNKQAESDSNNVQDVDGSAASDKKEGLRHRNAQSNNPTA